MKTTKILAILVLALVLCLGRGVRGNAAEAASDDESSGESVTLIERAGRFNQTDRAGNDRRVRRAVNLVAPVVGLKPAAAPRYDQDAAESPANPCVVYGSMETPRQNAQLFTIDLKQGVTLLLGESVRKKHFAGLAVEPVTENLYALVRNHTKAKVTSLALIDTVSGQMTKVSRTRMRRAYGLSFRPTDGTLWTWWQHRGLVRIDQETASVELVRKGKLPVSALAWDPAGGVLYLAGKRSLWSYEEGSETFELVAKRLPVSVGGLTMRGDGQLLLTGAKAGKRGLELIVFDPALRSVSATLAAPLVPIGTGRRSDVAAARIEALAWPVACGNPSPGGDATLIESIELDKVEICEGEMVHVRVATVHPEGGGNEVLVWINGQPGHERMVQFEGIPGPRLINVSASTAEGYADRETGTVELADCGPVEPFVRLSVGMNPFQPYMVDFRVANANDIAPGGAVYEWDFGDGASETNDVPFVSHSYGDALEPDEEYTSFEVSVTMYLPGDGVIVGAETIAVWNAYAANRKRGLIQPPSTYQPLLVRSESLLMGEYTLRNVEADPITLTGMQMELQACNPVNEPASLPWEPLLETLGPGEELTDTLVLEANEIPQGTCGIALHFAGEGASGRQVAAHLYFKVMENRLFGEPVTDDQTLATLGQILAQGLSYDPDYVSDEELYQLLNEGKVSVPPSMAASVVSSRKRARMATADSNEADGCWDATSDCGQEAIGCECDRGELPPECWWNPDGNKYRISCQATDEFNRYPPHLPNALKGDVILVGGCGVVGEMLQLLGQQYIHTGIMTENYVEIAHSTSTDKRASNDAHIEYLPVPHVDANVMRYGWPGAIREDVATAFSRVALTDPGGDTYWFTDFTAEPSGCPGTVVPPLVVKPPASLAHLARPMLHDAADIAASCSTPVWDGFAGTGYGHYRFFSYTDGTIAMDADYDHPEGEAATVCSSFVRYVLKRAGAALEGSLEPDDVRNGAQVDEFTADGLYLYSEALRKNAAQFGWDTAHDLVMDMSWFDPLYDVIADGIANQLVNCFVRDDCDWWDTLHQSWKNPGIGRAVSPDDIMYWDAPPTGVYGYNERLVYRSGGWKRVYRWAPSAGTGTVTGVVMYHDPCMPGPEPMAGARVILSAAGGLEAESGLDGRFEFVAVPAGTYEIEAQKQLPDVYLSSDPCLITVTADGTTEVDLSLLRPREESRIIVFEDNLFHSGGEEPDPTHTWPHWHGYFYQDTKWSYQFPFFAKKTVRWKISDVVGLACRVDPYYSTTADFWWQDCLGNSCLTIRGTATYCDGEGSCGDNPEYEKNGVLIQLHVTMDSQHKKKTDLYLGPLESAEIDMYMQEKDYTWYSWPSYGWDKAHVWLKLTNEVQTY
jgi:hypothetical protein